MLSSLYEYVTLYVALFALTLVIKNIQTFIFGTGRTRPLSGTDLNLIVTQKWKPELEIF